MKAWGGGRGSKFGIEDFQVGGEQGWVRGDSYMRCLSGSPFWECDWKLREFQPACVEFQPVTTLTRVEGRRRPLQDWEVDQDPSWLGVRNNKDPAGGAVLLS